MASISSELPGLEALSRLLARKSHAPRPKHQLHDEGLRVPSSCPVTRPGRSRGGSIPSPHTPRTVFTSMTHTNNQIAHPTSASLQNATRTWRRGQRESGCEVELPASSPGRVHTAWWASSTVTPSAPSPSPPHPPLPTHEGYPRTRTAAAPPPCSLKPTSLPR